MNDEVLCGGQSQTKKIPFFQNTKSTLDLKLKPIGSVVRIKKHDGLLCPLQMSRFHEAKKFIRLQLKGSRKSQENSIVLRSTL